MRKIIAYTIACLLCLAWSCSDEPTVKYNKNDLSVLKEIYDNIGLNAPHYSFSVDRPDLMGDITWEIIGGEYRVIKLHMLTSPGSAKPLRHELTPRIGELTYLRDLDYCTTSLEGEIPREIYNCPLENLRLRGSSLATGGIYPEISKVANTLRNLEISGISINIDAKELELIFDLPNLERVYINQTNLTGHVSARYGEQNYSYFHLGDNKLTSCDPEIFHTNGTFPNLTENEIYCEVPYEISLSKRWQENQHLIDRYDLSYNGDRGIGFKVMPRDY